MSTQVLLAWGILGLLIGCCHGDHPACNMWKKMADQLSNQPRSQMKCFANDTSPCTSLRCSGTYKYSAWMLPQSSGVEVDYCFGMRLNHCDNPVSMDVYLLVPAKNVSYVHKIEHNTLLKIPGLTFRMNGFGMIDVFLFFHMVRNGSVINLSITAKVRITSAFGSSRKMEMWPSGMQKLLVPEEHIPVPPCASPGVTPAALATPPPLGHCHPPTWQPPTVPPGQSTTTENPFVTAPPKSLTYNRTCSSGSEKCGRLEVCDLGEGRCVCNPDFKYDRKRGMCISLNRLGSMCDLSRPCGPGEICTYSKGPAKSKAAMLKLKMCQCKEGYTFQKHRQMCVADHGGGGVIINTVTPGHVLPHPGVTSLHNQPAAVSSNNTAIIAGSIVGGVVVLAFVCLIIFFLVKRARRPYQNREMLLSNDDSDVIM